MTCDVVSSPSIIYPLNDAQIVKAGFTELGGFRGPHVRSCHSTVIRSFLVVLRGNKFFPYCLETLMEIASVRRVYIGIQRGRISFKVGSDFFMIELSYVR